MKLENIVREGKNIGKTILVVGALYGVMEAHYNLPRNVRAIFRQDKSTPSAMFRTEDISEVALNYQGKLFQKYLRE